MVLFCSKIRLHCSSSYDCLGNSSLRSREHVGWGNGGISENPWFSEQHCWVTKGSTQSQDQGMRTKQTDGESFSARLLSWTQLYPEKQMWSNKSGWRRSVSHTKREGLGIPTVSWIRHHRFTKVKKYRLHSDCSLIHFRTLNLITPKSIQSQVTVPIR